MPKPLDALTLLAPTLRVRPELQDFCRFGGDWRSSHGAEKEGGAAFHIVMKGACSLERAGQPAISLVAGDVLLLPHGDAHVVYGGDGRGPLREIVDVPHDSIRVREIKGVTAETELVCGRLVLSSGTDNLLLKTLPPVLVLRLGTAGRFTGLIATMRDELKIDRVGAAAIACDLASALFMILLRTHFEANPPAGGLLALLAQRETAKAAAAMLRDPGRDWRLDELASIASESRSTLVRAFRRIAGLPPQAFLTEIRLGIARSRIMQTSDPVEQVAFDVGYQSEAALSRALLRRFKVRPATLRKKGAAGVVSTSKA
jgi:AraC family transcriptional activator of mtrCDE